MPLSKAVIVDNFDHFMEVKSEIDDPRRRRHLFLIMSKETAKFGYEERPSAVWSTSKKAYTCPGCGQVLYKEAFEGAGRFRTKVQSPLRERDFAKQYVYNKVCPNTVEVWNSASKSWEEKDCKTKLWTPLIKEDNSDWTKLSKSQGWIEVRHLGKIHTELTAAEKLDRKEAKFLASVNEAIEAAKNDEARITRAPRKYPVAKYIKTYYKGKIDYLIADELNMWLLA